VVIREPTDLKTLEKQVLTFEIKDREHFCRELGKMFRNCRQYNPSESVYVQMADKLERYITPHLKAFVNESFM
jgi:hypothetical protein